MILHTPVSKRTCTLFPYTTFFRSVLSSDAHVFNLGGDLNLFSQLIRTRDRDGLLRYATECVDSIHLLHTRLHPAAHTVALVDGDALGGGFELALARPTTVAQSGVPMGFPEGLFRLG